MVLVFLGVKAVTDNKPGPGSSDLGPALIFSRANFHATFALKAANVDWGGIPWRFALAQSEVETGNGNGGVFQRTMNLFSITDLSPAPNDGWAGPVFVVPSNGLRFRSYSSWEESMRDWVKLMHWSHYSKALAAALQNDFKGFAREVKAAGYDATNPNYAAALESRYDTITV